MMRSGQWTLVPPGRARAAAMSCSVGISLYAARLSSAARIVVLIGGSTARSLMIRNYEEATERGYARKGNRICRSAGRFELSLWNRLSFRRNNR